MDSDCLIWFRWLAVKCVMDMGTWYPISLLFDTWSSIHPVAMTPPRASGVDGGQGPEAFRHDRAGNLIKEIPFRTHARRCGLGPWMGANEDCRYRGYWLQTDVCGKFVNRYK